MKRYAIVLAAGKGTRMKSKREDISKVSFPILGRPLVKYVLEALKPLNMDKIVTIVGFGGEMTKSIVEKDSEIVWQKEQKGTGHAVMQTSSLLKGKEGEVLICCGDTPLLSTKTLEELLKKHEEEGNSMTVLTFYTEEPKGYGRIVKEGNRVIRIVEEKDCNAEERKIKEVNAGVYVFDNELLFTYLDKLTPNNAAGEYYLTDILYSFVKAGFKVGSYCLPDKEDTLGINDRYQLSIAAKIIQRRINKELMLSGVSIEDPDTTYIGPDVKVGRDTIIKPNTYIYGKCEIGEDNVLGPNLYLENVEIGDENEIIESHLVDTKIGNKTTLGPYLRTRKGVVIEDEAHIGNFNELKNVVFGKGSKAAHLSYLGDSNIGEGVNIGCGTITCNYDGFNKSKTVIGSNCFIGSNVNLVAPVTLGDNSFVAAGSTITDDVPEYALAIARQRQINKENWNKK